MTTKKNSTKRPAKGKAEGSKGKKAEAQCEADELTAERVRTILSDPETPARVKETLRGAVGQLHEWVCPSMSETPEETAHMFAESADDLHAGRGFDWHHEKARPFYERAVMLAEKHEPKDARLVRKLAEVIQSGDGEARMRIAELLCETESEAGGNFDLHPEIFPVLARVVIAAARKGAAVKVGNGKKARQEWLNKTAKSRAPLTARPWMLKKYLAELETLAEAGQKGGTK